MPSSFVILHHVQPGGEHWDLMLQREDTLLTWQIPKNPTEIVRWPIEAKRIADHRLAYLEYEGPISRNRGTVSRVDRGLVEWSQFTTTVYKFLLHGDQVAGAFTLRQADGDEWLLTLDRRS